MFNTEFDSGEADAGLPQSKFMSGREMQDMRDSAFEAGVNEGIDRESRSTEHRQSEALAAIAGRLGPIAEAQTEMMNQIVDQATALTLTIMRKLSPALAQHEPIVAIEDLIRDSLGQMIDAPHVVVRVPEQLIDELKRRIDDIAQGCGYQGRVVLMPDVTMSGSDCRLEWADGGIVRRNETILTDIELGVSRMLKNPAALTQDVPTNSSDEDPG